MKKYNLQLSEKEERLIEAVLFNEKHYIEEEYGDNLTTGDKEVLELIKTILRKVKVEVK